MLRKRTRSIHKDQHNKDKKMTISDADFDCSIRSNANKGKSNVKSNSIFNTPLLFVGLGPKGVLDSDSARSPTSPLDTLLSNLGNPFRTPKSSSLYEGQQRIWDCGKVGLGIIDSLEDCPNFCGKIILSSENKKPNLTPQMITNALNSKTYLESVEASKSLPKYFCKLPYTKNCTNFRKGEIGVLFEIGETLDQDHHEAFGKTRSFSLDPLIGSNTDSGSKNFALDQVSPPHLFGGNWNSNMMLLPVGLTSNPVSISSSNELVLSASEIELSEDYTCVISHGPNPKKTHIFCDHILETHSDDSERHHKNEEKEKGVSFSLVFNNRFQAPNKYPSSDFLSFCYHCNKKLEDGKDIYIYRGEKSFCSLACRDILIMIDEGLEDSESESNSSSENSPQLGFGGNLFEPSIPTAA